MKRPTALASFSIHAPAGIVCWNRFVNKHGVLIKNKQTVKNSILLELLHDDGDESRMPSRDEVLDSEVVESRCNAVINGLLSPETVRKMPTTV